MHDILKCLYCYIYDINGCMLRYAWCVISFIWQESDSSSKNSARERSHQQPLARGFDCDLVTFASEPTTNNGDAGDLRRHCAHYDVIIMEMTMPYQWESASMKDLSYKNRFNFLNLDPNPSSLMNMIDFAKLMRESLVSVIYQLAYLGQQILWPTPEVICIRFSDVTWTSRRLKSATALLFIYSFV